MSKYTFSINVSTTEDILKHLKVCDQSFIPPLSETISLLQYSKKLYTHAIRLEFWVDQNIVALAAFYIKLEEKIAFITNISVIPTYTGTGMAQQLMNNTLTYLGDKKISRVELEVKKTNKRASSFYFSNNFQTQNEDEQNLHLIKKIS